MRKVSLTIVIAREKWYWLCRHTWNGPMKMLFFKGLHSSPSKKFDFWVRNSIFENVFKIILSNQIWLLVTFWMSESHREHILNILSMIEAILRKTKFSCFLKILLHFQAILASKWSRFEDKNFENSNFSKMKP